MIVIAIEMTACSSESKEGAISVEADSRQETDKEVTADTKTTETETSDAEPSKQEITEEDGKVSLEGEENTEGYFSIAVGDKAEISYRGLLDDEKHPIKAVKIVLITVE